MKFYKETNLKETPIGNIPKDWKLVRLDTVAEIRGNKRINDIEKIAFIPMELISESQIFAEYQIRTREEVKSFTYCEAGDILLAKITPSLENGKQGIVPYDIPNKVALATTEVFPIYCKEISTLFLFYILKLPKFRNKIIASMTGTTGRQRATKKSVLKLEIPLPSLSEQQKIAEILSCVDLAIEKVDEAIARAERLKKGLMQQLLTKGIGHKEYKETPIGKIPKTWKVVTLEGVCEKVKAGGTPRTSKKEYWNGDLPFVKIEDITSASKYLTVTKTLISKEGLNNSSAWIVPENSLLLAMYGSLGEVAISKIPVTTNQAILGIVPRDKDAVEFLYYWYSFFKPMWKKYAKPTTQANLTAEIVRNSVVPFPPKDEQQKIAEILSSADNILQLKREKKENLVRMKRRLMGLLLTGRVRVSV